jgi:hypothetical protein
MTVQLSQFLVGAMIIADTRLRLETLFTEYANNNKIKELVSGNIDILKCVRGGLRMAEAHRIDFDPRAEYWRPPERRMAVAYLSDRWTGRFAPLLALRSVGVDLLTWFDKARPSVITYTGVDYDEAGGFDKICSALAEHARRMASPPAWDQLRSIWAPYRTKLSATLGDDVAGFLEEAQIQETQAPGQAKWEAGFKQRLPWFGYLGTTSVEALRNRQAFFYGYANLWTTTSAYRAGGALNFAPVIQNTKTAVMLDAALAWAANDTLAAPVFSVLGKSDTDDEPQDRSRYLSVLEVYGFLTLQHGPYFIKSSQSYHDWFGLPEDIVDQYEQTSRVGRITRTWLQENPDMVNTAATLLSELTIRPMKSPVQLETVDTPKVKKLETDTPSLDDELRAELETLALSELNELAPIDRAAIMLHILLAGKAYLEREEPLPPPPPPPPPPDEPLIIDQPTGIQAPITIGPLPEKLRPLGERALAYLKAGLHVVFAGAPGTGKTTVAQFVGYAWDHNLDSLPTIITADDAPLTTVGNSAWSPFHTIGGLMPLADGSFQSHPGIFIDPTSTHGEVWHLLNRSLVLDEMNRADLDRCIGELYPLLSGSVRRVSPAGLPGVSCIESSQRFRVIATINDTNLDDIVFPISEGLARRFQRIDLSGGSRDDVLDFLGLDGTGNNESVRRVAAYEAVAAFFEVARESKMLRKDEDDERLPFGVAYFILIKEWVNERLTLPESTPAEQAHELLAASLRPLGRSREWEKVLGTFLAKA